MANQKNVEVYANLFRVPIEDGARLVCECRERGESVAKYVGRLVHERINGRPFGEMERMVAEGIRKRNVKARKYADKLTRSGRYRKPKNG